MISLNVKYGSVKGPSLRQSATPERKSAKTKCTSVSAFSVTAERGGNKDAQQKNEQ